MRWIVQGCFVAALLLFALFADTHVKVTDDAFLHDPFFGFVERRYALKDLTAIRTAPAATAPSGRVVPGRYYELVFPTHPGWQLGWLPRQPTDAERTSLIEHLSKVSGVAVTEVDVIGR